MPYLAVGPDGTAVLVANDNCCGYPLVRVRRPDGSWESAVTMPGGHSPDPDGRLVDVAIGADGTILVAYVSGYRDGVAVWERAPDGTWAAPVTLGTGPTSGITWVRAGLDRDGNALVAWPRSGTEIWAEERAAGEAWQANGGTKIGSSRMIGGTAAEIALFDMGMAPGGAAVVAWSDYDPANSAADHEVQAIRRTARGAAWSASPEPMGPASGPGDVSLGDPSGHQELRADAADDGTAVVAWLPTDSNGGQVDVAERSPGDAGWTVSELGPDCSCGPDDRYKDLALDVNAGGDALVGWWTDKASSHPALFARRPAGGSWTVTEQQSQSGSNDYVHVQAGLADTGDSFGGWEFNSYGGDYVTGAAGFTTGPVLTNLVAPDGEPGNELTFGVDARETWGSIAGSDVRWTFGDGGTATGSAPKHTYAAPGDFGVSVQATDSNGIAATKSTTVHVAAANVAPTATFTTSPTSPQAGQPVRLNASASDDPDGVIAVYEWDLDGDGTPDRSDGSNDITVSYPAAGDYDVALRVRDDDGAWSAPVTHTVHVSSPPAGGGSAAPSPASRPVPIEGPPPASGEGTVLGLTVPRFKVLGATRRRTVPDVVGMHVDRARTVLDAVHWIRYEIDWVHSRPPHSDAAVGEVLTQAPRGVVEESGVADLLHVALKVYAGPRDKTKHCPAGTTQAIRGRGLDLGEQLIAELKCVEIRHVDYDLSSGGKDPKVSKVHWGKVVRGTRQMDLTVDMPRDIHEQDLFLVFSEYKPGNTHTFNDRWRLPVGGASCLRVQVFDRDHSLVQNAEVRFDMSDVGGRDPERAFTDADGQVKYCSVHGPQPLKAAKEGTADVVAFATGINGETAFGTAQVYFEERGAYTTPAGRHVDGFGHYARVARSAGLFDGVAAWFQGVTEWFQGGWEAVATPFRALGDGIQAVSAKLSDALRGGGYVQADRELGIVPGNMNPGHRLSVRAGVIASGAGNVIASGGGNVIASGAGNVIASGGGNVIANGALNLIGKAGGNVIASGAGNVISYGGGNVIAAGGGNVIASGGGNVIASGGGNVIASGALNRSARAARANPFAWRAATDSFRVEGRGVVLKIDGGFGATMAVADGTLLPTRGEFIAGVKDATRSAVVHLGEGIWVLRQPAS